MFFVLNNGSGKPDGLCGGAPAVAGGAGVCPLPPCVRCPSTPGGPRHRPRHDHPPRALHHRRHVALPLPM